MVSIMAYSIMISRCFLWLLYMFCLPKAIHVFQQESYNVKDYFRWVTKNPKKAFLSAGKEVAICLITMLVMLIIGVITFNFVNLFENRQMIYLVETFGLYLIYIVLSFKLIFKWKKERKNAKKKLVYTPRVKRLLFWAVISILLIKFSFISDFSYLPELEDSYLDVAQHIWQYCLLLLTMPIVVVIANWLAWPTETFIDDHYINSARFKLLRPKYRNLIRIGITGSFGKTSTKMILKTILSEKFNVLATPESYNTTMGNVKIIRKELKPEHQVFISEMGARYPKDIKKICDIVYPQIGIITSIGSQHLESFKNVENVAKTKAELLSALPKDGAIFLPKDNSFCTKLYNEEKTRKKFYFSSKDTKSNVYAKNIKLSKNGSEFVAVTSIGEIKCQTKLLGELNIQNILSAIAVAVYLGLSKEQIASGVSKIEPVEHRLQILPSQNGTTVIDDAFNSNPLGSKMALDVLKSFDGRKIIITPGMVELGEKEEELNKEFGKQMAGSVDIAILVGVNRSKPIEKGLIEGGFDKNNIYLVNNLDYATKKLSEITRDGDVILFENDLPDNYNE